MSIQVGPPKENAPVIGRGTIDLDLTEKANKHQYAKTRLYGDCPESESQQAIVDCLLDYRVTSSWSSRPRPSR